jgi:cytochrome c-type biogenesis protein CcmF
LTIILLLVIAGSVFIGSVLPTLTEALPGQRLEAGSAWFDRVTGPQFAALVLLMGICPLLGRTVGGLGRLGARGLTALLGAVLLTASAAWAGFTRPVSLVGFAVVGLAGATILVEYGWDAVGCVRRGRESPLLALWHLFGRNHRRYGGYLVHAGIVLIAVGVLGTRLYSFDAVSTLSLGESVTVGEWTLLLEELQRGSVDDHLSTWASLSVYRDGRYSTTLQPRLDEYAGFDLGLSVPALWAGLREDLYVVLAGVGEDGPAATVKVFIKPLASFLWLGGVVLLIGGGVALGPAAQAGRLLVSKTWRGTMKPGNHVAHGRSFSFIGRSRRGVGTALGLIVVLSALVVVGVALGRRAVHRPGGRNDPPPYSAGGRPLPGRPAPDFTVSLLGGSALALSDLRGQVAVVNFWATWCLSCEEELPELQALWEQYREQRVVLVGVALEAEKAVVQEMASRFGVTYPLGLDVGDRISAAYGITGVPETFVVDTQGRVAYVHVGPVSAEQLGTELDSLLGEGR